MAKVRVLIADSQPVFVAGLLSALEAEVEVVASCPEGSSLAQAAAEIDAEVVVVDFAEQRRSSGDAIRELKARIPKIAILVFSASANPRIAEEAFRAGADGYLVKGCAFDELFTAIREIAAGRSYVTPVVAGEMLDRFVDRSGTTNDAAKLTRRQREVLQLIAEGHSTKRIAEALNISPRTAESHRYALMKALDLHSTADLTRYAIRQGIVSTE